MTQPRSGREAVIRLRIATSKISLPPTATIPEGVSRTETSLHELTTGQPDTASHEGAGHAIAPISFQFLGVPASMASGCIVRSPGPLDRQRRFSAPGVPGGSAGLAGAGQGAGVGDRGAILKDLAIPVLEVATSSLDGENERLVQEALSVFSGSQIIL